MTQNIVTLKYSKKKKKKKRKTENVAYSDICWAFTSVNGLMVDQCSLALIQELKHNSKRKSAF